MSHLSRLFRCVPPEVWALLLIALPMAFSALERIDTVTHHPSAISGPNDPDPWLRLTLVRDWLEGGDWFDHRVARSNAPEADISSPWTRPLDLVIAAFVKLQPSDDALTVKLLRAAAALPLLWMIVLMLGLFKAVRPLHPAPMTYLMLGVLVGATPVLWSYFGQGNADHHGFLAALWVWVLAYATLRDPRPRDCWIQGALLALMLWISPEALLLIALLYAWQLLRWLHDGERLLPLVHLTSATAYMALVALAIERAPDTWLVPIYDSLSIVHVVLLVLCALIVRGLAFLPPRWKSRCAYRALAATLGGVALICLMAVLYPPFFHGPMADASPFIAREFLPRINEAKSLFSKPFLFSAALLFLPLATALLYVRLLWVRQPLMPRATAAQLLFLLLAVLALACTQLRWYYYVFPITALMLAPLIGALFSKGDAWPQRAVAKRNEWSQACIRIGLISLAIALPMLLFMLNPKTATLTSKQIVRCEKLARTALHSGAITDALGADALILYAPTNLGAEILFFTPYRILASNYHREGESIRYVWNAQRIPESDKLQRYFARRQVDALLLCPDSRSTKKSQLTRWWKGDATPAWLEPVTLPSQHGKKNAPRLFRITE